MRASGADVSEVASGVDCGSKKAIQASGWQELEGAAFLEAVVATIADHDVIEQLDTDQLPALGEAPRECEILGARGGIAGRVVVDQNDAGRTGDDGGFENLAGVDDCGAERANRDEL